VIFAIKAMKGASIGYALAFLANIAIGRKGLSGTNTLAFLVYL